MFNNSGTVGKQIPHDQHIGGENGEFDPVRTMHQFKHFDGDEETGFAND
jgi:hypothetical protein